MTLANRILLKVRDKHFVEFAADANTQPGHIVQKNSDGGGQPYSVLGGKAEKCIAIEDSGQGNTINGTYFLSNPVSSQPDMIQAHRGSDGDEVAVRVTAGTAAIANGASLMSNGAGGVVTHSQGDHTLFEAIAASTAISNTTAATAFSNGSYSLPANFLQVGDIFTFKGALHLPATNSTDTIAITLVVGTTTIATIPAYDPANNDIITFEFTMEVLSIATTTCTVSVEGHYAQGAPGTAADKALETVTATFNSTIANTIAVKGTWSVASTGDQVIMDNYDIEVSRVMWPIMAAAEALDNSGGSADMFIAARWL